MSGFFSHVLLTEVLKRPLKSRKKNGSECSCLRRDEQASKNSSNSAEGLDKLENEADLAPFPTQWWQYHNGVH